MGIRKFALVAGLAAVLATNGKGTDKVKKNDNKKKDDEEEKKDDGDKETSKDGGDEKDKSPLTAEKGVNAATEAEIKDKTGDILEALLKLNKAVCTDETQQQAINTFGNSMKNYITITVKQDAKNNKKWNISASKLQKEPFAKAFTDMLDQQAITAKEDGTYTKLSQLQWGILGVPAYPALLNLDNSLKVKGASKKFDGKFDIAAFRTAISGLKDVELHPASEGNCDLCCWLPWTAGGIGAAGLLMGTLAISGAFDGGDDVEPTPEADDTDGADEDEPTNPDTPAEDDGGCCGTVSIVALLVVACVGGYFYFNRGSSDDDELSTEDEA